VHFLWALCFTIHATRFLASIVNIKYRRMRARTSLITASNHLLTIKKSAWSNAIRVYRVTNCFQPAIHSTSDQQEADLLHAAACKNDPRTHAPW